MILNNTQANIFKVNGGIADNFANRPAASGSFYIFYSIDTQEIYYDNGAWILLGSGGGGGVNIYNSDGTLTGNRTLNGANNDLNFADLNIFKTSIGGNDIGLKLDFANNFFGIGNNLQDIFFYIENNYKTIVSQYNGNVEGLKLDFIQRTYELGNLDYNFNRTIFIIDDNNEYIKTKNQGNDIGLKLDFANSFYSLGDFNFLLNGTYLNIADQNFLIDTRSNGLSKGISLEFGNDIYRIGDYNGYTNGVVFNVNNNSSVINTNYQGNDIGLKLDFANSAYQFGQITGGGQSLLTINDTSGVETIFTSFQGNIQGFEFQLNAGIYRFGHLFGTNTPQLTISESNNTLRLQTYNGNPTNTIDLFLSSSLNDRLFTRYSGADNGIIINFSNYNYVFGRKDANNFNYLEIDDTSKTLRLTSLNAPGQYTNLFLTGGANAIIKTQYLNVDNGIKLDFANTVYQFGQINGNNQSSIEVNDNIRRIRTLDQGLPNGFELNFLNRQYELGQIFNQNKTKLIIQDTLQKITLKSNTDVGITLDFSAQIYKFGSLSTIANQTYLTINDSAAYPVQLDGTNITSGTAGSASGQHLKIKLNGVDYKIELRNP